MKKLTIILVILVIFSLISCNNNDDLNIPEQQAIIDVYVSGKENENACYWKNNQQVILDNNGLNITSADKIFVNNNNVYVWGTGFSMMTNELTFLYWNNGIVSDLNIEFSEPDFELYWITDFYVVNDDVYFLGFLRSISNPTQRDLVYWKNGIKTIVLENINYTNTNSSSIRVINNDIYVSSRIEYNQPGIFINNIFNPINPNYNPYDMTINGNDSFIHGSSPTGGFYQNINTGEVTTSSYRINDLVFDQSDIYTVVDHNNESYYREIRKNGNLYYLSPDGYESDIPDLYVHDGDIYAIVRELIDFNSGPNKLLINNVPELILDNSNFGTDLLTNIYVVQN